MSIIGSVLRFAAKGTWLAVSRVLFFAIAGLVLNIVLFWYLPDMCDLTRGDLSLGQYMGGIATNCTAAFVVGILLIPVFPALYAFLGYKYAIQKTIHYAYVENKDTFYEYTVNRLVDFIDNNQSASKGVLGAVGLADRFFDKLDNMPFVLKNVMKVIKKVVPFVEIENKINEEEKITDDNQTQVAARLAAEADTYVQDELLKPDLTLMLVVLFINLLTFGVAMFVWG